MKDSYVLAGTTDRFIMTLDIPSHVTRLTLLLQFLDRILKVKIRVGDMQPGDKSYDIHDRF